MAVSPTPLRRRTFARAERPVGRSARTCGESRRFAVAGLCDGPGGSKHLAVLAHPVDKTWADVLSVGF